MFDEIKKNLDLACNYAVDLNDKLSKARLTNNHQNCSTKKVFRKILLKTHRKKETPVRMSFCKFMEIFKNTYVVEHLRTTTSLDL